jgi:hypothetical protein
MELCGIDDVHEDPWAMMGTGKRTNPQFRIRCAREEPEKAEGSRRKD